MVRRHHGLHPPHGPESSKAAGTDTPPPHGPPRPRGPEPPKAAGTDPAPRHSSSNPARSHQGHAGSAGGPSASGEDRPRHSTTPLAPPPPPPPPAPPPPS